MSSVTEPYPPQERSARRTRRLLQAMLDRPPDVLVIQSHTPIVVDDVAILTELKSRCQLQINITVETDRSSLPAGFPGHAYPPDVRIEALRTLRRSGLWTVATVSPLLPLADTRTFASALEAVCDRVILDHYLLGDGSPQGSRTKQTALPMLLERNGFEAWTGLENFNDVVAVFQEVFGGEQRVGVSRSGFNTFTIPPGESGPQR